MLRGRHEGNGATVGGARGARGGDEDRLRWRGSPLCDVVTGDGVLGWDGATRLVVGGAVTVRLSFGEEQSVGRHGSGAACNSLLLNRVGYCSIGAQGNEGVLDKSRADAHKSALSCATRQTLPQRDDKTRAGLRATGAAASYPTPPRAPGGRGEGGFGGGSPRPPWPRPGWGRAPRPARTAAPVPHAGTRPPAGGVADRLAAGPTDHATRGARAVPRRGGSVEREGRGVGGAARRAKAQVRQ